MKTFLRLIQDSSHQTWTRRDCENIIAKLMELKNAGHHVTVGFEDVRGGNSSGAMLLADFIWEMEFDTHAMGDCLSAACIAYAGGHERTASASVRFMLHEANNNGQRCDLMTEFSMQRFVRDMNLSQQHSDRLFGKEEVYFRLSEAIDLGLVNHVNTKSYEQFLTHRY